MTTTPPPAAASLQNIEQQGLINARPRLLIIPAFEDGHFDANVRQSWLKKTADDFRLRNFEVSVADANAANLDTAKLEAAVAKTDPQAQAILVYSFARPNGTDETLLNKVCGLGALFNGKKIPFAIDVDGRSCILGSHGESDTLEQTSIAQGIVHESTNTCVAAYFQSKLKGITHAHASEAAAKAIGGQITPY